MIPAYRRTGGGVPLVCHPGGPGSSAKSFGGLAGLGAAVDLVLVDPRGTGATPRPDDPRAYTIDDYVGDLEELREELALERMNLLGWSHGGVVAMKYAAAHPERVAKLVLYATLPRFQAEQEEAMAAAVETRSGEPWYGDALAALEREQAGAFETDDELTELVYRELPLYFARYDERARDYLEAVRETWNADTLRFFNTELFSAFDLLPELGRITCATLVLVGAEDFLTGPVCAREIAAGLPHADVVTIEGAGHFVHVEQPERFREEVLAFLAA